MLCVCLDSGRDKAYSCMSDVGAAQPRVESECTDEYFFPRKVLLY